MKCAILDMLDDQTYSHMTFEVQVMSEQASLKLALYKYDSCPFCVMTHQSIRSLGLEIDMRDILLDSHHREDLIKGGGKPQVPCLRIEDQEGHVQWLYESRDIIDYLRRMVA